MNCKAHILNYNSNNLLDEYQATMERLSDIQKDIIKWMDSLKSFLSKKRIKINEALKQSEKLFSFFQRVISEINDTLNFTIFKWINLNDK